MMAIDYSPIKECKRPVETYGEICVQCNECGRFSKHVGSDIHIVSQFHPGYPPLWDAPVADVIFHNGLWKWMRSRTSPTYKNKGNLMEVLPPSWWPNRLPHVRWWIEGRNY